MRAALLLMLLALAVLWTWLARHPPVFADALTLAEVYQGLREGQGLGHWLFSTAPSLFPDLGATALATWLGRGLVEAQRWHGFFLGLGLGWGAARLLQQLWGLPKWQARAFAAAGLLLGLTLIPAEGLAAVLAPGHHGWACVMALWAWAWAMQQGGRPARFWPQWSLMLGWGLALASDRFLLLWALLPLLVLGFALPRGPRSRVWLTVLGAWPFAWLAGLWLRASGAKVGVFQWSYAQAHAHELLGAFKAAGPVLLQTHAWSLGFAAVGLALWIGAAFRAPRAAWALGAWALTLAASSAICLLAGAYGRYLLFPFWALLLMTPALVAMRWPWLGPASMLAPALLGLLWLAPPAASPVAAELRQSAWMDQMAEQRGLSYGVSDYFHSRPLRLFSAHGLQVLPMVSQGTRLFPHLWVVDRRLFPDGQLQSQPQFAIVNGLDPGSVRATLGSPREVLQGEGLELWIYREPR